MLNKTIKILIKIIIILIVIQTVNIPIASAIDWGSIISAGDTFVDKGKEAAKEDAVMDTSKVRALNNEIYSILLTLGVVLSVIIGAVLGIQIMWGSIEQQVKAKEMLIPYVVGCVVVFGTFGIWKIAVTIFSKL